MTPNTPKTAVKQQNGRDAELDRLWAETAVKRELEAIGRCHGDNPHLPHSEFWACLVRIASVIKGSGRSSIAPSRVKTAVLSNAPASLKTKGKRENDIEYLFGRAMNQARPRHRIKGTEAKNTPRKIWAKEPKTAQKRHIWGRS